MTKHKWFREYCEKTTSHGMQYFVMRHRSPLEKIFWVLTFATMFAMMFYAMITLANIWINSPTVMYIENKESAIREIPFPMITICPSNQLRRSVWEKYADFNDTNWKNIQHYQSVICSSNMYTYNPNIHHTEYIDYKIFKNFMLKCAVSCPEVFQSVIKWQNRTFVNFCNYIQPMLSPAGLCYVINMLPTNQMFNAEYHKRYMDFFSLNTTYVNNGISRWNLDDGYSFFTSTNILVDVVPFRTSGVSYYHRLKLILHVSDEEFIACPFRISASSFFITFTTPNEHSSLITRSFIVPETYTKIQITPFVKRMNENLKWRSPEARKCYLHNERKLLIFQQYSEKNCRDECIINRTVSMCGCIHFSSAYLVPDGVKLCGPLKVKCMVKATQAAYHPEMQSVCNCLPTCSMIEYEIAHTSHYENWTYMKTANLAEKKGATVEIVFKNPYFTAYKSTSILDVDSLISVVGGILSLLLGINLINIFEIFYVVIQMIRYYIMHILDDQF